MAAHRSSHTKALLAPASAVPFKNASLGSLLITLYIRILFRVSSRGVVEGQRCQPGASGLSAERVLDMSWLLAQAYGLADWTRSGAALFAAVGSLARLALV